MGVGAGALALRATPGAGALLEDISIPFSLTRPAALQQEVERFKRQQEDSHLERNPLQIQRASAGCTAGRRGVRKRRSGKEEA